MKALVIFLVLLFGPTLIYAHDQQYLCLLDVNGKLLFKTEIQENSKFAIRFIHSVAKSPVEDWFTIKNGQIYLQQTIYQDFGAGLPYKPEGHQTMKFTDGKIIISGYNMQFTSFDQRVGRIANHTLLLPDQNNNVTELELNKLVSPGQAITFTVKVLPPK